MAALSPEECLRAYEVALGARRFEAVAPFISEDAVFWFTDGAFRGHAEIARAMEATWRALPDERYALSDLEWIGRGPELAMCRYRFAWESRGRTGAGRGSAALKRGPDGWQICHEHLSL